ncbi:MULTISPECIES: WD40 domain-containing protein [Methylocaldum]|uniref:WD40 domain-containing protein n=1 Tax=Methylocaldum sp. 14B TaxID=1912213 RepID=UPI00098A4B40|nr:WD40 repeat domain-containing protein [Methylocaldum sp. 14B]
MSGLNEKAPFELIEPQWRVVGDDYITALAWSPDGSTLAAASAGGPILLLVGETGGVVHELPGHGLGTLALDWSCDGRWLASGGQDGKARVWDAGTGAEAMVLDGGSGWVEHVAWSPRGDLLSSAAGKFVKLWKNDGELCRVYGDHASTVTGLAWLRDGRRLATACYGGVKLWRIDAVQAKKHFQWKGSFLSLSLSPNDEHLAAGCQDASLLVWNVKTAKNVGMSGYPGKISLLNWDASSRYLASGADREAVLWNFSGPGPANREPFVLSRHIDRIADLRFHPKRDVLATVGQDGMLILWNIPEGIMKDLCILKNPLTRLAWSPQGNMLAVGSAEGEVCLLSVR